MEDFKTAITIESITMSLISGRPLSRKWGFPDFLLDKKMESVLSSTFGEEGYKIYSKMSNKKKKDARTYFETCGEKICKMYKAELWEDWDDSKTFKFDLQYLFDNHYDIYKKVVENIADRCYGQYPKMIFDMILERFLISPKDLSETIVTTIKKK